MILIHEFPSNDFQKKSIERQLFQIFGVFDNSGVKFAEKQQFSHDKRFSNNRFLDSIQNCRIFQKQILNFVE